MASEVCVPRSSRVPRPARGSGLHDSPSHMPAARVWASVLPQGSQGQAEVRVVGREFAAAKLSLGPSQAVTEPGVTSDVRREPWGSPLPVTCRLPC